MLKPTICNVVLYLLVKYLLFYAGNIVYQGSYQWLDLSNLKIGQDVFYWLWMFGFLPLVSILLFAVPLSLILRLSRPVSFGCALVAFVVVDYTFYVFLNSQKSLDSYGLYHETIGLLVIAFLFHGRIRAILTSSAQPSPGQ
jgi:hypothetical protein